MSERRLSTPLVLATASLMASVGLIGAWRGGLFGKADDTPATEGAAVHVRKPHSPEATAEAFLDAWRKRDFAVAAALSTASAKSAVLAKQTDQEGLSDADRVAAEKVWGILAADRLRFLPNESENLPGGALALRGTAKGTFAARPYERKIGFELEPYGKGWLVRKMELGDVLSDTPSLLDVDPANGVDLAKMKMREPPQ